MFQHVIMAELSFCVEALKQQEVVSTKNHRVVLLRIPCIFSFNLWKTKQVDCCICSGWTKGFSSLQKDDCRSFVVVQTLILFCGHGHWTSRTIASVQNLKAHKIVCYCIMHNNFATNIIPDGLSSFLIQAWHLNESWQYDCIWLF